MTDTPQPATLDTLQESFNAHTQALHGVGAWYRRMFLVVAVAVSILVFLAIVNNSLLRGIDQVQTDIRECTTQGPRTPTPADPGTGHDCYDEGSKRTGAAILQIVDTNGNGIADIDELARLQGTPLPTTTTIPAKGRE